jgi:DNA-directed RNA polymerase specialized sigma24 family protein
MERHGDLEGVFDFEAFLAIARERLRRVLVARYGPEVGLDVMGDVEEWSWLHWGELQDMHNPLGYLYRVAQSKARPHLRWNKRQSFPAVFPEHAYMDPDMVSLHGQLATLTDNQRICVLMVHAYGWTHAECAEVLDMSTAAVGNHVRRGIDRLRSVPEIDPLLQGSEDHHA